MFDKTTDRRAFLGLIGAGTAATALGITPAHAVPAAADPGGPTWLSGAGDDNHGNNAGGGFGNWRGEKLTYATIWTYPSGWTSNDQVALNLFTDAGYDETLNLSLGWPDGASWQQAATGGMDDYFSAVAATLVQDWNKLKCVHLSFAYEFNGTWMPWSLNGQLASFKQAWHRWTKIIREQTGDLDVKIVLPFSAGTQSGAGATVEQIVDSVGTDAFDVLGVDFYSAWPDLTDEGRWDQQFQAEQNGPRGVGAWQQYAEKINKPFAMPEWGLSDRRELGTSDNPFFISKMNDFFRVHAPTDANAPGAGELAGESLFNTWDQCRLWPETRAPKSADRYRSLTWGR